MIIREHIPRPGEHRLTPEPGDWEAIVVYGYLGSLSIGGGQYSTCAVSRNQAKELIPLLQYWAEHGNLPETPAPEKGEPV
jgi:hypothetical protein